MYANIIKVKAYGIILGSIVYESFSNKYNVWIFHQEFYKWLFNNRDPIDKYYIKEHIVRLFY